jgi:hypothetical protein
VFGSGATSTRLEVESGLISYVSELRLSTGALLIE